MFKSKPAFIHALCLATFAASLASAAPKPNVIYILADDLGYGDVRILNPQGKIPTPHMDRLAAGGIIFTDAHSTSSVCSPSRYSILTGRYNWRSSMKYGVLNGYSPRLIEKGRMTVAAFLKQEGYHTACIGKWHVGMDWPQNDGTAPGSSANPKKIDYVKPIQGGPTSLGFDSFFGISASLDMVPYVFIENDRATELPTAEKDWGRKGAGGPSFEGIDVLPTLTRKAVQYISARAADAKSGKPFFLYLPLASPHTPILPTPEWQGKSGLNKYADFVMQTDATVGALLDALDKEELAENTLVVMTSDNGCSREAKFPELLAKGHNPNHHFRGSKSDIWEGGHRVPFLVRWPARVKSGTTSDQLVSQTDFFATCAEIVGEKLGDETAEDSVSMLPALLGQAEKPSREAIVHSAIFGAFAIRQGPWKLVLAADSGGWSDPQPGSDEAAKMPPVQLYDLSKDIGETRNVQAEHPEIVARLRELLQKYISDGRSTPGTPRPNTGEVEIYSTRAGKKVSKPAQSKAKDASPASAGKGLMQGDELKSEQKSAIVFKEGNDVKDARLKLAEKDMKWWRDAKFGMFIHWGLYAIPATGEWSMTRKNIPVEVYDKFADEFIPKYFDGQAWAKAAKDAGMNYMVLTARHHDGFALWDSPSSHGGFNSVNRAAKRDFVAEYVKACRDAGLGVGLYYSPMDWRFPGYFKPRELADNAALLKKQCYGQIEELMKNYGKIDVLWYDGGWLAHEGTDADAAWFWEPIKLNSMVREYQPKAVINPRSGWEGDFKVQEGGKLITGPIIETPWEKCLNLNKSSWGFNTVQKTMPPQEIVRFLVDVVGRGGNMLLNVGPDRDGVIPAAHVAILKSVGDWLGKYGQTLYGTKAGPFQPVDHVWSATHKENKIFIHVLATDSDSATIVLPALERKIIAFKCLSGGKLAYSQTPAQIELKLSNRPQDGFPTVIELVLEPAGKALEVQTRN